MPFDPTKPATNAPIVSAELRNQFTGLKDLIDAIPPAGPETDPVFMASEAHLFVAGDKDKLDAALVEETDPVFAGSEAALFVAGDKAKLDAVGGGGGDLTTNVSHNFGDVVQPSTDHDTFVMLTVTGDVSGFVHVFVGPNDPPSYDLYQVYSTASSWRQALAFVVPKGQYFKLTGTAGHTGLQTITYAALNV